MRQPCARVPYKSSAEAKAALVKVRARRGRRYHSKPERSTYKCRRCGQWHLTSMWK